MFNRYIRFISVLALVNLSMPATAKVKRLRPIEMSKNSGQTYLNFLDLIVRPAIDKLADEGYELCGSADINAAYESSDKKVQKNVDLNLGGTENVVAIAEITKKALNEQGIDKVTRLSLQAGIEDTLKELNALQRRLRNLTEDEKAELSSEEIANAKIQTKIDKYGLVAFLGFACGGGVVINFDKNNSAINVHYDASKQDGKAFNREATKSGRSFGVGPTRQANDASDAQYLRDLEEYVVNSKKNVPEFYRTLFQSLLDTDSTNYPKVTPEGQTLLTDFLAVFTAEQIRNLMDGVLKPHWDAALLEVTLLAAFHSGQKQIQLYYADLETDETTFTASTYKQEKCMLPYREKPAQLVDYWQFSRTWKPILEEGGLDIDILVNKEKREELDDYGQDVFDRAKKNCSRSGINVTNDEFRLLEQKISDYVFKNNRQLYDRVVAGMKSGNVKRVKKLTKASNLFYDLSKYLINQNAPRKLDPEEVRELTDAWLETLAYVGSKANKISSALAK